MGSEAPTPETDEEILISIKNVELIKTLAMQQTVLQGKIDVVLRAILNEKNIKDGQYSLSENYDKLVPIKDKQ